MSNPEVKSSMLPPQEHPTYGMLQISRLQARGGDVLFGSSIKHTNIIRLRIAAGMILRDMNEYRYRSNGKTIIEVDLSMDQFAEAITTLNYCDGTPCTIRRRDGKDTGNCPERKEREVFVDEFTKTCQQVASQLDTDIAEINKLLEGKMLNKQDKEKIRGALQRLRMEVGSNLPFIHSQFDEAIDKTTAAAKAEINGHMANIVLNAGQESLVKQAEKWADRPPQLPFQEGSK